MEDFFFNLFIMISYIVGGIIGVCFLIWQIKRLFQRKFNIFTVLKYVVVGTVVFSITIIVRMIIGVILPSDKPWLEVEEEYKYLDTSSALSWGVSKEDIFKYNMGDQATKEKLIRVEPYIKKTKYFY